MKLGEKNSKSCIFWKCDFYDFWASRKWKKSNHQKCENFIKRPYFFIAAFERRFLNSFFGPPEPSRKIFFSDHREVNLSKFSFFAKNHGKNNVFAILEISKIQKSRFWIGFSIKMSCDIFLKINFLHKNQSKITIFTFFVTTKIQKSWFFNGFSSKMNPDTPKNHDFFIVYIYTSKKWKKTWFLARTYFSNFEFT